MRAKPRRRYFFAADTNLTHGDLPVIGDSPAAAAQPSDDQFREAKMVVTAFRKMIVGGAIIVDQAGSYPCDVTLLPPAAALPMFDVPVTAAEERAMPDLNAEPKIIYGGW